ncbi:serine/arginine-rich splicing factor SR45 [Selaginella moellendorffii]|uniref:serine/arginine-rich splicing factor SR45 n=1 Tax=Selaginella moellendorffii TaxID=88036 RepID=UPI000D1C32A9|nr:serine/arginine-rich splicing factor SR45 [Selaginella moellendorffii]|eukprot:XP_024536629.1 serine/arginine-rich splicing factor SR45 [Selaginella moellendorffii]
MAEGETSLENARCDILGFRFVFQSNSYTGMLFCLHNKRVNVMPLERLECSSSASNMTISPSRHSLLRPFHGHGLARSLQKSLARTSASSGRSRSPRKRLAKPAEDSSRLHVSQLSRNANESHLKEIFGNYGDIIAVDLAMDKTVNLPKGFAYVDYKSKSDAEKAQQFMDGAQVDGLVISVKLTRKVSPARGVFPKRDAAPPRRRPPASSPVRRRSPSPGFRRRRRSPNRSPIRRPMGRQRSPAPYRRRSPLPVRRGRTPPRRSSPVRRRSRTPPPRRMRSPPRRMMRSRSRSRSAPRRARSPPNRRGRSSSYSSGSPSPVRRRSPVRGGARKSTRSRSPKRATSSSPSRSPVSPKNTNQATKAK